MPRVDVCIGPVATIYSAAERGRSVRRRDAPPHPFPGDALMPSRTLALSRLGQSL